MSIPKGAPSYFLCSLESLNNMISKHFFCALCEKPGGCKISASTKNVVCFDFVVVCQGCGSEMDLSTSPLLQGSKVPEVNMLFFSACMGGGMGKQEMNSFLSTLGHPIIPNKSWEVGGDRVGKCVTKAWEKRVEENLVEELEVMKEEEGWHLDKKGRVKMECTFDGTWSTRGYSSLLGFATYFGVYSKKPLFTGHRCKICRVCQSAESRKEPPKEHDCPKNWTKSSGFFEKSGSMEASLAVEGAKKLVRSVDVKGEVKNVRIGILVGDGDAKIDHHLRENLDEDLLPDRNLDTNHVVKNFTGRMYNVKARNKAYGKCLTKSVIQRFTKNFSREVRKVGHWEEKKRRLENIPVHYFNKSHEGCGDWCLEKKEPGGGCKSLPYGRWLQDVEYFVQSGGEEQRKGSYFEDILGVIKFYSSEDILSRLDSKKSTNINEAYHGLFHKRYAVGGKGNLAPKSSITQNKFACCSISTSHSRALLDVLLLGGLSPTSPIAISMEKKGEEELERKEKRREKSKTIEGRRKRKEMRERKKVKKGEKDYQSQIELQKGGEEANDKKRKREGEGEGKGKEREEEEGRLTKKRLTLTKNKCGLCHELGHNKRTCPKK